MSKQVESLQGWYEDPEQPGQFHFYDGQAWGDIRLSQAEVPPHLIQGFPGGAVQSSVPSPRQVLRTEQARSGLLGAAGAWLLLALAAGVLAEDVVNGGWVVAGVLAAMFPCVIVSVIGLRAAVHGSTRLVRLLGVVTALVAAPGAMAAVVIALAISVAMMVMGDGRSLLTSDPLDLFGLFRVRDREGGVDGAYGVWLWAALGWCGICFAILRWGV